MTAGPAAEAVIAAARAAAAGVIAEAEAERAARLAAARAQAEALIAAAREAGAAEGRGEAAREAARGGVLARLDVLAARREAYDELLRRARADVLALREEPGYDELLERLARAARVELGDAAVLEVDPPEAGGVRARAGSRQLDLTLVALAEQCVESLGLALRRLWA